MNDFKLSRRSKGDCQGFRGRLVRIVPRFGMVALAAAIAVFWPSGARASEDAVERYLVGVEDVTYFPHYGTDLTGTYGGYGRAILDAFADAEGIEFIYQPLPVSRLFLAHVTGQVDLKYPDSPLWSAELKAGTEITYSDPVTAYTDGVMVVPNTVGTPVDDIKVLGTVQGFTAWPWMDRITSGTVFLSENASFEGLVMQALVGRVDGTFANLAVIRQTLVDIGREGALVFDETLPHVSDFYYLASSKHPDLIARFNDWIRDNDDHVQSLKEEYGILDVTN